MRTTHLSTLMLAGSLAAAPAAAAPVLTVYTYDSFVAEWGPGPTVEEAFEADCGCDLQFVATGDGAALLARLLLEGEATEDRKSTRLNSSHVKNSYAVFCLKKI